MIFNFYSVEIRSYISLHNAVSVADTNLCIWGESFGVSFSKKSKIKPQLLSNFIVEERVLSQS